MNDIITQPTRALAVPNGLTREQTDLLKRTICKGATDDELQLFVSQCNRSGLDPFSKQIHAVKRWSKADGRDIMAIQVGIDGFRLIASRTGKYRGQLGPFWCGPDGIWKDVWLSDGHPAAAKVGVLHADFPEPLWGIATWASYVQTTKDGKANHFWQTLCDVMIAKCAEGIALRKAFPQELSNTYTPEEMAQDDNTGPRPKVATVTGEVKSKKPEWTPDQTARGGDIRKAIIDAAGDSGDGRLRAIYKRMAYDDPEDVIAAMAKLLTQCQEEQQIVIEDADKRDAAAGQAQA